MNQRIQNELEIIKESVLTVVPDTEGIYLFGSYAYGTPREDSDLDVYVVVPDAIQENPLSLGAEIQSSLYKRLNTPLDLMVGKSSVFKRRQQEPTLQKVIARDGVLLYEQ